MSSSPVYIYKSNGFYFGFISNGTLYSRDGIYLGWIEGNFVWDSKGRFRGTIVDVNGNKLILINRFTMIPPQRTPIPYPAASVTIPNPPSNIAPMSLSVEVKDGFD